MTKKSPKNKLTADLKQRICLEFVQGLETESGDRKSFTLDELIKKHNVASATLYRAARSEGWKAQREQFNIELQEKLNEKRLKDLSKLGVQFDDKMLQMANEIVLQAQTYMDLNKDHLKNKSKALPPNQFLAICNGLQVAQKLGKIALGETTENINVNTTIKEAEAFRSVMDLLDSVKKQSTDSNSDSLH